MTFPGPGGAALGGILLSSLLFILGYLNFLKETQKKLARGTLESPTATWEMNRVKKHAGKKDTGTWRGRWNTGRSWSDGRRQSSPHLSLPQSIYHFGSSESQRRGCAVIELRSNVQEGLPQQNINLLLGIIGGAFRESHNRALTLLHFNQSGAGLPEINDLWVLALTGAYSSQSSAPLPPNVTFNEPISPQ